MWNKPNFETNTYELGNFNELTEAQMLAADGEAGAGCVGTCVGIGYVCWEKGGFKGISACLIAGAWVIGSGVRYFFTFIKNSNKRINYLFIAM